jgi:hypothetical protein
MGQCDILEATTIGTQKRGLLLITALVVSKISLERFRIDFFHNVFSATNRGAIQQ